MPTTALLNFSPTRATAKSGGLTRAFLVKTSDGQLHKISDRRKLVLLTAPKDYNGIPDALHLPNITKASLLHTLRVGYNWDKIYTSAGLILMLVNPYKTITMKDGLNLYAEERVLLCTNSNLNSAASSILHCHLFQVADRAYKGLLKLAVASDSRPSSPRKGRMRCLS
jgi:myosin heavy subunit